MSRLYIFAPMLRQGSFFSVLYMYTCTVHVCMYMYVDIHVHVLICCILLLYRHQVIDRLHKGR